MQADVVLYLIRHGQTDWNRAHKIQGHLDTELSEIGRQQAQAVAERLRKYNFDHCYSSDLKRAQDTAQAILAHHSLTASHDQRLRERDFGSFQGLRLDEIEQQMPEAFALHQACDPDFDYRGGQSRRQKSEEVVSFLSDMAERHRGQHVLAISHGGSMSLMVQHILGIPLDQDAPIYCKNAGLCIIEYEAERWILRSLEA